MGKNKKFKLKWLITDRKSLQTGDLQLVFKTENFCFYCSDEQAEEVHKSYKNGAPCVLIDGYVLPRYRESEIFTGYSQTELIQSLFEKYGFDFIHHIKGNFILILISEESFYIYSDRLGVRKCFYHESEDGFIIADSMHLVTDNIICEPDYENIAVRALMHFYIDGITFIKNVFSSTQASVISFDRNLIFKKYWEPESLTDLEYKPLSYKEFAYELKCIVKSYKVFLNPDNITLTLTGGLDSRTVLAVLNALGIRPSLFTYGNPESGDVNKAEEIASVSELDFYNFPYPEFSSEWFKTLAEEITQRGSTLINIHRAHRLYAMKQMKEKSSAKEMVVGGFLGGENIRGIFYDNLIVSDFLRQFLEGVDDFKTLVRSTLEKYCFNISKLNIDSLAYKIKNLPFFKKFESIKSGSGKEEDIQKQLLVLYYIEAQYHHAQDLNLYSDYVRFPVPLFMDADFLELLYRSHFDFRKMISCRSTLMKGLYGHELNCRIINESAPEISKIPFIKRGYFSADEYLGNKALLFVKRIFRRIFVKKDLPNFPLGIWMKDFVEEILPDYEDTCISEVYDIGKLRRELEITSEFRTNESFWQKYTMPAALLLAFKEYIVSERENKICRNQ